MNLIQLVTSARQKVLSELAFRRAGGYNYDLRTRSPGSCYLARWWEGESANGDQFGVKMGRLTVHKDEKLSRYSRGGSAEEDVMSWKCGRCMHLTL